jgi:hypothetical protein
MKEEWLFPAALIPVDRETTHALVAEIKRLIDVVGGMALAQPPLLVQEPVAWMFEDVKDNGHKTFQNNPPTPGQVGSLVKWKGYAWTPLYTTPPKRPWVELTDEDKNEIIRMTERDDRGDVMALVEAALKEKNT